MNSAKSFFFMVFVLAASVFQAKSPVYQLDIFYEISKGNVKAVKAWLDLQQDISVKNDQGQSLLHAAVLAKNRKIIKMLVKAGVAVNALDVAEKTALDYAVELNQNSIAFKLVKNKAKLTTLNNQELLKQMYKKRYKRLCWVFGSFLAFGFALWLGGLIIINTVFLRFYHEVKILFSMGVSAIGFFTIGALGIAELEITSAVRMRKSYLLN